ncbi:MAG TPA: biopolymer transporter ExbD [Gemmatimonadota bacterium]|nr:biopolymer transporter ExbD [Gemmatimonadota bacterium]
MRLLESSRRKALINVTSLIDVVFLLLLFFVVTSTFLERPGIDLSLPESGSAEVAAREDVTVRLGADGSLFVGEEPVAPDALEAAIRSRLEEGGTDRVVLEADEAASHGRVVDAMDAARNAGAAALVVATRPEVAAAEGPGP